MSVTSVSGSSATNPYTGLSASAVVNSSTVAGATTTSKKTLGQEDFLKLLSTQLQNQDPMKPMDDTQFIAQMAQFSSLQSMTQMQGNEQQIQAASYIGRNVTVNDVNGKSFTGLVTAVDNSGSSPAIVINNVSYALSTVKRIEPYTAPVTTTTSSTTSSTTTGTN